MRKSKMGEAELALITFSILGALPALAIAGETVNYTYDAKGRLVEVKRSGSVNNNITTNYTFDKADNRTAKTTAGSANPPPP